MNTTPQEAIAAALNLNANAPEVKGAVIEGHLVIALPLNTPAPSASGKTLSVGSTRGNKTLPGVTVNGQPVIVGANAYIYRK